MKKAFLLFFTLSLTAVVTAQTKVIVYFHSAESTILPQSAHTLDSLARALLRAGRYQLTLNGYCDSTGLHPGNITLGRARACSVYDYLTHHGISGDSMVRNGFAESDPAARGSDDISKSKNRRVEIIVSRSFAAVAKPDAVKFDATTRLADLQVGQQLVIKNLNFVNNEATLVPESIPTLKMLLQYMEDNPSLEIKLNGHVCCTDDMSLSVDRARFVYNYLVRHDISAARMSYMGYSNHVPLASNDVLDPDAAKVNRRVEITVVKK